MMSIGFHPDSQRLSHLLNVLALWGICGVLLMALAWQVMYDDLPCPLCLLQRVAFVLVGIGVALNLRFGASSMHYAVILLSALAGAFASGRQLLLHIAPGDPGYGLPFLGLHFYTWAFVLFALIMIWTALMLIMDRRHADLGRTYGLGWLGWGGIGLFFFLITANLISTLLECGVGPCADNPTSYLWLS